MATTQSRQQHSQGNSTVQATTQSKQQHSQGNNTVKGKNDWGMQFTRCFPPPLATTPVYRVPWAIASRTSVASSSPYASTRGISSASATSAPKSLRRAWGMTDVQQIYTGPLYVPQYTGSPSALPGAPQLNADKQRHLTLHITVHITLHNAVHLLCKGRQGLCYCLSHSHQWVGGRGMHQGPYVRPRINAHVCNQGLRCTGSR